jgi:hypothetical protein
MTNPAGRSATEGRRVFGVELGVVLHVGQKACRFHDIVHRCSDRLKKRLNVLHRLGRFGHHSSLDFDAVIESALAGQIDEVACAKDGNVRTEGLAHALQGIRFALPPKNASQGSASAVEVLGQARELVPETTGQQASLLWPRFRLVHGVSRPGRIEH